MTGITGNHERGFAMEVGGLSLSVYCDGATVCDGLRGRYRSWLRDASAEPVASIEVIHGSLDGDLRPVQSPSPEAVFAANGTCRLAATGYEGVIAADGCWAGLNLAAPDAMAVDYFLRAVLALMAYQHGGLLLHAAGVLRNGRAVLFSGRSGVGKSTTIRLSAGLPGTAALGDDLILLLPGPQGWHAHGTPFWNPETPAALRCAQAQSGALAAILRLAQDRAVFARPLAPAEAVAGLLSDLPIVPLDRQRVPGLLARLSSLVEAVPVAELHFQPDPTLWSVVDALIA